MAGRLEDARRACRKLLAKRADLAEAHVLLAEIHRLAGDDGRARESRCARAEPASRLDRRPRPPHARRPVRGLRPPGGAQPPTAAPWRSNPASPTRATTSPARCTRRGARTRRSVSCRLCWPPSRAQRTRASSLCTCCTGSAGFDELEAVCRDGHGAASRVFLFPEQARCCPCGGAGAMRKRCAPSVARSSSRGEDQAADASLSEPMRCSPLGRYERAGRVSMAPPAAALRPASGA